MDNEVNDGDYKKYYDLQKKLFDFAVNVIKLIRKLPKGKEYDVISYQLIKAATSSGANYDEAQGAVSKPDFSNKIGIALKEMNLMN
jgi:four helix bundle protein